MKINIVLLLSVPFFAICLGHAKQVPAKTVHVSYEKDIAPLFTQYCAGCHNPQNAASAYDLSTYKAMMKGGNRGPAIVPGKSAASTLYRYCSGQIKPAMPLGTALKPTEIALIKRWIDAGAAKETGSSPVEAKVTDFGAMSGDVAPPVTALAFTPDHKMLLVGTYRQVQCWNIATGKRVRVLKGASENVTSFAFSPDGKTLGVGGGVPTVYGEVILYHLDTGALFQTLKGHTDVVYGLDFLPDGKRLVTASGDKTLRLWNLDKGETQKIMKDHADSVYAVKVTPDGKRIVSTGVDRSMKVWDAETGKPLYSFNGRVHGDTAYTLTFSPDGSRMLTSSGDHTAKLWTLGDDPDTSKEFRSLAGHEKAVHSAVFSPDGLLVATASADGTVDLWSGVGGGYLRTLTGARDWVYSVVFTPDSRSVIAGTYDGQLLLWNVEEGAPIAQFSTRASSLALTAFTFEKESRILKKDTVKKDIVRETAKEPIKPAEIVKVAGDMQSPEGPAYNGKVLFVSNTQGDTISVIQKEGKAVGFQKSNDKFTFGRTNGLAFFEDGTLFACDFERKAILQIYPDGRTEMYADKCEDVGFKGPNDLAFDPAGNLYFTDPAGSDLKNPIGCVYRVAKGSRKVTRVAEGMAFPNGIAFSADGKTLYLAESGTFRVLRARVKADGGLEKSELFCQLPDGHIPDGMNFDQAGNLYVATMGPGLVTVLDREGKTIRTIKLPGSDVTNVEFGDKDYKTLYITEAKRGEVYKIEVEIGGLPLFRAPQNQAK